MDLSDAKRLAAQGIIDLRRAIHRNPELSFQETRTAQLVRDELARLGIPCVSLAENCIVATIGGQRQGRRLAIRADMDALPIKEETGLAFASACPGVMHACGHDGHTAVLLGAARLLKQIEHQLDGTVLLCFQSAEEVGGGAQTIIDHLESLGGVDQVIAQHLWADIESGQISIVAGARMAAGDGFTVEVVGRGGHGSRPDLSIDPIRAAAQILLALCAIPANRVSVFDPAVVHVGKLEAGSVGNAFPNRATLHGGIRSFSAAARERVIETIHEIAEHGAKMHGASASVTIKAGVPPVVNDPEAVARARAVVGRLGTFALEDFEPIGASENFGCFLQKYPGFMAFIGVKNPAKGLIHTQHHPKFDIDEDVLADAAEFFAQYAIDFLAADAAY